MTEPAPHLLVIDDDARMRALLKRYLSRHGMLVSEAASAAQARAILAGLCFDLIVLDVMMPGEDGLSFARHLRDSRGEAAPPVLMLTARAEAEDRIAGLETGVDDYLPKPFEPRELLLRISAILRRAPRPVQAPPPRALMLGEARFDAAAGELWRGEAAVRLTGSEAAMLQVLAETPHEPVPRHRLAGVLGGAGEEPSERAVDVQMTRLRKKLGDDPRQQRWLRTVRGEGYMLTPD